ncbi:OLC1v1027174C1 [Oldenlandia corymbosa var. corymbosa]|uniref:OLC1v1027174C1 n=1 Tax=Oldenlandia corymbosa var. corymbosa TaxID=529605 RepID=A0AAV1C8U5_OLDCO|nr:OLC1v1027174C1 [Oldenlandia corymbosa var. corymbosa]
MASLISRLGHCVTPNALRSYLAEFISTFLYVFAAVGSAVSSQKFTAGNVAGPDSSSLVAVAIANAFALSVAVFVSANISGGHVNPAVTFGMAVGGHISIPMSIMYWISQMLASVMACLVIKVATVGQQIPTHGIIPSEMTGFGASVLEGVMTFVLVYTVYAAADKKRGCFGVFGPLAVGLIAGANILASGPFTGGSMNPAHSFGSAVVGGSFKNHAVYWVGPLIGAAIAGLLYDNVVFPAHSSPQDPLTVTADGRV